MTRDMIGAPFTSKVQIFLESLLVDQLSLFRFMPLKIDPSASSIIGPFSQATLSVQEIIIQSEDKKNS